MFLTYAKRVIDICQQPCWQLPSTERNLGAREERVRLQRPLREALAADEVARREELLGDLQPALRLRPAVAGASASSAAPTPSGGEVHGGLGEEMVGAEAGLVLGRGRSCCALWRLTACVEQEPGGEGRRGYGL